MKRLGSYCVFICILSFGAHANDTREANISVAIIEIENLLQSDDNSLPYNRLLNALSSKLNTPWTLEFYPTARAISLFSEGKSDCLFPADSQYLPNAEKLIQSQPLNYSKVYLVSRANGPHFQDVFSPEIKRITVQLGYSYGDLTSQIVHNKLLFVSTIEQQIGMLLRQRADVMLVYEPDLGLITSEMQRQHLWYDITAPLSVHRENLVCWDTPENQQFIHTTNRLVTTLPLLAILGDAYAY